jgi:branched-chain amino acid transport system substrate-binding protein
MATNYRGKSIAILHDKSTYGKSLADQTKKALNGAGIKEKLYEAYTPGENDFTSLISRLKSASIDVVYIGGFHTEAGLILRQMRNQGMTTQMISGDAIATSEFWSVVGAAGEGTLFTFGPDPTKKPAASTVVKRLRDKNLDATGYTLYTYAAVQVWAQAAAQAGTGEGAKIATTMKAGTWDTVLGKLSFTPKGDPTVLDYTVYRWDRSGNYGQL